VAANPARAPLCPPRSFDFESEKTISWKEFQLLNHQCPFVLSPILTMQEKVEAGTFGEKWWAKKRHHLNVPKVQVLVLVHFHKEREG
jgi:hypothetical protein